MKKMKKKVLKVLTADALINVLSEVPPKTRIAITCATLNGSSLLPVKRTGYGSRECEHAKTDGDMFFFLEFDIKQLIGDL